MANPIPCGVCKDGTPGQLLVTDQTDDFQIMGKPTVSVCVPHLAEIMFNKVQELQATLDALEAAGDDSASTDALPPGEVEQTEGAGGPVPLAPTAPSPSRGRRPKSEGNGTEVTPEAEAADVER